MFGSMPPFFFPESGRLAGAECGRGPDADVSSPPSEGSITPGRADEAVPGLGTARMARMPCPDIALPILLTAPLLLTASVGGPDVDVSSLQWTMHLRAALFAAVLCSAKVGAHPAAAPVEPRK
jgi:hypothetical protein